jgi:succinate-acetate transporter protein
MHVMNYELANPKSLGYAAIFIAGWMFSLFNTEWYTQPTGMSFVLTGLIVGGIAVGLAGLFAYMRGESYEFTLFLGFGALFFTGGLSAILSPGAAGGAFSAMAGWIYIVWTVFFLNIFLNSMKKGFLASLFSFGLFLTLLDLAIANWIASSICLYVGGYIGLVTAALAACLAVRELRVSKEAGAATEPQAETRSAL